eukprot:gene31171-6313_t
MGGSLVLMVDALKFKLTTPKLELFDIWLQPTAESLVWCRDQVVEVIAGDCLLTGSHHVEDMKFNDRFIVDVNITFLEKPKRSPSDETKIQSKLIEAVGNTALALTTQLIISTITNVLVNDYNKWAATRIKA